MKFLNFLIIFFLVVNYYHAETATDTGTAPSNTAQEEVDIFAKMRTPFACN